MRQSNSYLLLVAICLFFGKVYAQNPSDLHGVIPENEYMKLRIDNHQEDSLLYNYMQISNCIVDSIPMYHLGIDGKEDVLFSKIDMHPYKFIRKNAKDGEIKEIRYFKDRAEIEINGKKLKNIKINSDTYDRKTLFYVLRKMIIENRKSYDFSIIVKTSIMGFVLVEMTAERKGLEKIKVDAGEYMCERIEMGVSGAIGKLFWPVKYSYYFTEKYPNHFVKYFDPDGEVIELVEYKTGS